MRTSLPFLKLHFWASYQKETWGVSIGEGQGRWVFVLRLSYPFNPGTPILLGLKVNYQQKVYHSSRN